MILSDRDIRLFLKKGSIGITAKDAAWKQNVGPSSLDLRLGDTFKVYTHSKNAVLDPKNPATFKDCVSVTKVKKGEAFIVQPGEFVLGVTAETVSLSREMVARVEGRSSLGRLGIVVHSTAGFIDPGFSGTITLEIANINRMPVALYPGMRVCQLAFQLLSSPAEVSYADKKTQKYQGQEEPEESRIYLDPELSGRKK